MRSDQLIDWIHGARRFGEKAGLQNMHRLLGALGDPQARLKCIHVAGTNAKGSVCAIIESALRENGYSTGLYTSPFLIDYRERIRFDGRPIDEASFERAGNAVREAALSMPDLRPTAFELGTAIAFLAFARRGADACVIETGIGGRLDPTNVLMPAVSVITSIGLDHMRQLGGSIEQIALEKAGIVKPGVPVALYPQREAVAEGVIERACQERGAPLFRAADLPLEILDVDARGARFRCEAPHIGPIEASINLAGRHQVENAHLALAALALLKRRGWPLTAEAIAKGFAGARWPGRLSWWDDRLLLDGAHNPQAARALRAYLDEFLPGKKLVLLTAMMQDKQPEACADVLAPCAGQVIATTLAEPRALPAQALGDIYRRRGVAARSVPDMAQALLTARAAAGPDGVVVACGSLYLVGALMKLAREGRGAPRPRENEEECV